MQILVALNIFLLLVRFDNVASLPTARHNKSSAALPQHSTDDKSPPAVYNTLNNDEIIPHQNYNTGNLGDKIVTDFTAHVTDPGPTRNHTSDYIRGNFTRGTQHPLMMDWIPELTSSSTNSVDEGYSSYSTSTSFPRLMAPWIPHLSRSPFLSTMSQTTLPFLPSNKVVRTDNYGVSSLLSIRYTDHVIPFHPNSTKPTHLTNVTLTLPIDEDPHSIPPIGKVINVVKDRSQTRLLKELSHLPLSKSNLTSKIKGGFKENPKSEKLKGIKPGQAEDVSLLCLNTFLVIQSLMGNTIVVNFYKRQLKSLIPFVYFTISITDLLTSVSCLFHFLILLLVVLEKSEVATSILIMITYCSSSLSIRSSVFYNVILSAIRTVNIVQPFYQVQLCPIKIAVWIYPVIWGFIVGYDVLWLVNEGYMHFPRALFKHLIYKPMAGSSIITEITNQNTTYTSTIFYGMTEPFLLPAAIVSICFIFQIHYLRKTRLAVGVGSKVSRRPAVTIFHLTTLFLLCNLTSTTVYFYYFGPHGADQKRTAMAEGRVMFFSSTTLHLINAAFTPVILIFRGRSLKKAIRSDLSIMKERLSTKISISSA